MKFYVFWFNVFTKFVPKGQINNKLPLVQIMARRRPGDKPLSELMVLRNIGEYICASLGHIGLNNSSADHLSDTQS